MQTAPIPARSTRPFPLPSDLNGEQSRSVFRAATAAVLHEIRGPHQSTGPAAILEATWPSDARARGLVTRAATNPASTTTTGWAAELVPTVTGAFLTSLGIASSASQLFAAAVRLSLDGVGTIRMPYATSLSTLAPPFVGEGLPAPVRQASLDSAVTLGPVRKMLILTALTNELNNHSTPTAEVVMRQLLTESAARQLDAAVFSATAGDAVTHAGLLNGVTPIAATTGGGVNALLGDTKALLAALTAAGAGQRVMIFAPPAQAAAIPIYAPGFNIEVVPTVALASTSTVVAVDPSGVFSGYSGEPQIDTSSAATLHMESSSPLQLTTGAQGSAVVASPQRGLFQVDSFALRLRLPCAWVARPGFVQQIVGATW